MQLILQIVDSVSFINLHYIEGQPYTGEMENIFNVINKEKVI